MSIHFWVIYVLTTVKPCFWTNRALSERVRSLSTSIIMINWDIYLTVNTKVRARILSRASGIRIHLKMGSRFTVSARSLVTLNLDLDSSAVGVKGGLKVLFATLNLDPAKGLEEVTLTWYLSRAHFCKLCTVIVLYNFAYCNCYRLPLAPKRCYSSQSAQRT